MRRVEVDPPARANSKQCLANVGAYLQAVEGVGPVADASDYECDWGDLSGCSELVVWFVISS